MRIRNSFYLALITSIVALAIMSGFVAGFSADKSDAYAMNEMVTITGKVTILNHPELGVTPFNGAYLIFQRADCKRCLVATYADMEGNYKIIVGKGQYKVISYNPNPVYDLLAPDQPRYVAAKFQDTVFDIKIVLPKD